jgi:hypothetical protein
MRHHSCLDPLTITTGKVIEAAKEFVGEEFWQRDGDEALPDPGNKVWARQGSRPAFAYTCRAVPDAY